MDTQWLRHTSGDYTGVQGNVSVGVEHKQGFWLTTVYRPTVLSWPASERSDRMRFDSLDEALAWGERHLGWTLPPPEPVVETPRRKSVWAHLKEGG